MRASWKRVARWLLSSAAVVVLGFGASARQDDQRQVLVLYSTGRDAQISIVGERELPRILDRGLARALDYYSEYIDAGRFSDERYQAAFRDFLRMKYAGQQFDVVIAMQDVAIEFLRKYRGVLFPETPVVFFALNPVERPSNSTGVIATADYAHTLELATRLQPEVRQVFVVSGAGERDKAMEARARAQFQSFAPRLAFTYLSGLRTSDLEQRLANLPARSIVYYLLVYQDGGGGNFQPLDYLDRIAAVANRPIYSWVDSTIGRGVVGGSMQRQQSQVDAVGDAALRVLHGEAADQIPVSAPDLAVAQVDWRQLQRWGISEARVPAGTDVLFRDPGIWSRYRGYIVGAALLIAAQTTLLAGLLVQAVRRRRAEEQVRRSQTALRASYNRVRDLGARLLHAQEDERSRIARELHDDVGQQAGLLAMNLHLLITASRNQDGDVEPRAEEALHQATGIVRTLRNLSHRLHPATLRLVGLLPSLNSLPRDFSQSGIDISVTHRNVPDDLPPELSLCLFRIAQEALTNAVKHSAARRVSVNLTGGPEGLTLTVVDDGVGFDVNDVSSRGLGLISMSERLDPLGGTLTIRSTPGAGTHLEVTVPLRPADTTAV